MYELCRRLLWWSADDQLALLDLHIPHHGRPHAAGIESADHSPVFARRVRSTRTRRRILPDGDFGISLTNSTARTFL